MINFINAPARPLSFDSNCSLSMVTDEQALQDNLRFINGVAQGECLLNVKFGSRLRKVLFEKNDLILWLLIDTYFREAITTWDPRIQINNIHIRRDTSHNIVCFVEWKSKSTAEIVNTQILYTYGGV